MIKKSPNVVVACRYNLALNHPDRRVKYSKTSAERSINGIFKYYSDNKKRVVNMFDYFTGKINKEKESNLVIENGKYATEEEIKNRKKEYLKYFENSNLWLGVLSFNNDYIDSRIKLDDLEQVIIKKVMPKFLSYCGFTDIDKMSYQIALHTNTDNYHFHFSFIEKEANYKTIVNKKAYRRVGKLSKDELSFFKREVEYAIDHHYEFTKAVIETNKEIDDLKKYFKPEEKNFLLRNSNDLLLEEKLLKLGELLNVERNGKQTKIKFNSIRNKEIKSLTKDIKKYLFSDKSSKLYKKQHEIDKSLEKINMYFHSLDINNNVNSNLLVSDYSKNKQEYIDNYIYNAIVNHSLYEYKRNKKNRDIKVEDLIKEISFKNYKRNNDASIRKQVLKTFLSKKILPNKAEIEKAISRIDEELDEATREFSKLFINNERN